MNEVGVFQSSVPEGVSLTEAAKAHIIAYLQKEGAKGVRFSIKKAGCSGLSYVLDYVQAPAPNDVIFSIDTHYILCIDKASYPYIKGMRVDYVTQGLNKRFEFQNPNQTGVCGCGESFTV